MDNNCSKKNVVDTHCLRHIFINNAGVVHSFHPIHHQRHGGGGAVDRRVDVSLTIPTQRSAARTVSSTTTSSHHVMNSDHSVSIEGGREGNSSYHHHMYSEHDDNMAKIIIMA